MLVHFRPGDFMCFGGVNLTVGNCESPQLLQTTNATAAFSLLLTQEFSFFLLNESLSWVRLSPLSAYLDFEDGVFSLLV